MKQDIMNRFALLKGSRYNKDGFNGYCDECKDYVGEDNLIKHETADLWYCTDKCYQLNEAKWFANRNE